MLSVLSAPASFINEAILTDIGTLLTQIGSWITGNLYLSVFMTIAIVFLGLKIFHSLRNILGKA